MIKWGSKHCILFATKEFKKGKGTELTELTGKGTELSGPVCFSFTSKKLSAFIVYVESLKNWYTSVAW